MSEPENETSQKQRFSDHLVVGLGASAGGLEALEEFFDELPSQPGMSFVVVTHQAPGKVSLLPELIARRCKMPVAKVTEPTPLEPNKVYVQPPGATLGLLKGELFPFEPDTENAKPFPIDFFFRTLAQDQRDRAVGIVLSGTGSDGTKGLKEIRAVSGLVMAQDESTARYPGMPHSASVALQLDFVLAPREMARQLLAYREGSGQAAAQTEADGEPREVMGRLFVLLRNRTGHDFSNYKTTTIGRRIARRMSVHQIGGVKDYLKYVQTNPHELDQLFKELLIGVTSFFRDTEAFEIFSKTAIPHVLASKPEDYVLRAWIAGCSTGEEAYSLAMLLREHMDEASIRYTAQVFATDLDNDAIEFARAGVFPDSIASDVSPKRLERFFVRENGYYRIRKEVREMVVFAVQDLVEDPAFTKLDFLVCRNLLIYLNSDIQKRLIPLFHYALKPGGVLMLGSSETVGGFSHLFDTLDKKWKIFQRREVPAGTYVADVALGHAMEGSVRELRSNFVGPRRIEPGATQIAERALLQHLVPPSVIMHESGEIVHIQGRTGLYLEPASGSQTAANIYTMARDGLQLELTLAVRRAANAPDEILHPNVKVKTNGDYTRVNLRVKRLSQPEPLRGLFLVAFERVADSDTPVDGSGHQEEGTNRRISDLERELSQSKEFHQGTVEELETTNEELKSANEELQSMNEELQSANEELETSKEEMQSLNEELQTVNVELQGKVEELSRTNDDMKNLLNATDIGTIFLDNDLNIKRHTEQAKRVIRLIPSDVGRPIGDLVSNLHYSTLVEDAREVLRTLVYKETEVRAEDGSWYLMRIMPYRTTENMIDGLVITFVNVSKVRSLQAQTERLLGALTRSQSTVFGQNRDLKYEWAYGSLFGHAGNEATGKTDAELVGSEDGERIMALKREVIEHGARTRKRVQVGGSDGKGKTYELYLEPVPGDSGSIVGVLTRIDEQGGGP
jgi:two-component system CheB/CheR fusion protein